MGGWGEEQRIQGMVKEKERKVKRAEKEKKRENEDEGEKKCIREKGTGKRELEKVNVKGRRKGK